MAVNEYRALGEFATGSPETTNIRWGIAATMFNMGIDPTHFPNAALVKELEEYFLTILRTMNIATTDQAPTSDVETEAEISALLTNPELSNFGEA